MPKRQNFSVRKSLRLTDEEDKFLQEQVRRSGLNENQYLRRILDVAAGKAEMPEDKEKYIAVKELTREINYIGHNINQIVRNVNSHFYSDAEKERLFELMCEIKILLKKKFL